MMATCALVDFAYFAVCVFLSGTSLYEQLPPNDIPPFLATSPAVHVHGPACSLTIRAQLESTANLLLLLAMTSILSICGSHHP